MNTNTPTVVSNSLEDFLAATQRKALMALNECLDSAETLKERMQVITTIARFKLVKPPPSKEPTQPQPPRAAVPANPLDAPTQSTPHSLRQPLLDQPLLARVEEFEAMLDVIEKDLNARERAAKSHSVCPPGPASPRELLYQGPGQQLDPTTGLMPSNGVISPIETPAQRIRRAAGHP